MPFSRGRQGMEKCHPMQEARVMILGMRVFWRAVVVNVIMMEDMGQTLVGDPA